MFKIYIKDTKTTSLTLLTSVVDLEYVCICWVENKTKMANFNKSVNIEF